MIYFIHDMPQLAHPFAGLAATERLNRTILVYHLIAIGALSLNTLLNR
jgi:hypothetical protein